MGGKRHQNQEKGIQMSNLTAGLMMRAAPAAISNAFPQRTGPEIEQKWEELEELFQVAARGVIETAHHVNTAIAVPGVKENVKDPKELKIAIDGLTRDLTTFTENLANIHARHEGRTGLIKTPQDVVESIEIFEEYVNFNTQFKSVTLPTVLTIMDHVGTACENLTAQAKESLEAEQVADAQNASDTPQDTTSSSDAQPTV